MAAHPFAGIVQEEPHTLPQRLLELRDRAASHKGFDGEGIQLWLEDELAVLRYGVDPDSSRKELEVLVESSTSALPREAHRDVHESSFMR